MKVVLMADHGGFELKEGVKRHLEGWGIVVHDVGTHTEASVDFPVLVKKGVEAVKARECVGIFICGSGVGVSQAANRYKGIRAVNLYAMQHAEVITGLARQHNNSNVLCLAGRYLDLADAIKLVRIFLETGFLGGKYDTRNKMLDR